MIGQTLGHYSIIQKIGAGGMGEVYRARDQHLERDVALKVLPTGVVPDDATRRRFRREALALSKLNHPNIATVFDFDTQDGVDFLAMEFIDGIPLSDRVAAGALAEYEVLRVGTQLAEGLAAAHAEGIVHRDLKPGNLMIAADGRLKILDFGLAILLQGDEIDLTHSRSDQSGAEGTLPYMSPEQVRGLPGDARSDVYAAGAVLYELATAKRPFPQTHANELIGAILHESSTPPRHLNPRISERLDRLVTKALDKEPSARYQTARELLLAIDGVRAAPPPQKSTWRVVALGAATVLVAGVLLVAFNAGGLRDRIESAAVGSVNNIAGSAPRVRRAVAVIGFKNLSGKADDGWVSTALAEMLTTELAAGGQLRTIAGENVARMKIDLSLADAGSYGPETLTRVRSNIGADDVVMGSYLVLADGRVRLDFTLQHAATGETIRADVEQGRLDELDDLVRRAGTTMRETLGAARASNADLQLASASVPSSLNAMRPYAEGLARFRLFDYVGAREQLEKAVKADPDNALARSAMAAAWVALGYDEKARDEARRAFELSKTLSRENQLSVEGQYRRITAEQQKAVDIYRTLVGFFPDNLDYGLQLASTQVAAGQGKEALGTIERLRKLPAPMSADPRIDLAEAGAAGALSDYQRQRTAAENAATKGSVLGARLLVAQAQLAAASALGQLGSSEDAIRTYERAMATFLDAGDYAGAANAQSAVGSELIDRGEFASGDEMFNQAIVTLRRIGDQGGVASTLFSIGLSRYRRDDLPAARRHFQQALDIWRELNHRAGMAGAYSGLGIVLMDQGDASGAIAMYEQSLVINRETGFKAGVAVALHNIGMANLDQSSPAAARARAEEALAIRRQIGDKPGIGSTTRLLGNVLHRQGDVSGALKYLNEALALQVELGQANQVAYTREYLSQVLNDAGRAAEAEPVIREAIKTHQAQKAVAEEALCLRVLAESQLAQAKVAEAQASIDAANRELAKSPNVARRLAAQITQARIRAAAGAVAEARASLANAMTKAASAGLVEVEFEARLSIGEIELKNGNTTAGRSRLAELETAAKARGLGLYVNKARAALRSL